MVRDAIYEALTQQLLKGLLNVKAYGVLQVSRGFIPWEECEVQPAVFVVPKRERGAYNSGLPVLWTIEVELYIYVRWTDSVAQGVTALAQVMDGIDYILSPTGPNGQLGARQAVNTLGGLVAYCAISGECEVSGGFLNKQQTVARMPVEILVPG